MPNDQRSLSKIKNFSQTIGLSQNNKKSKSVKNIPRTTIYGASARNWNKRDQEFEENFEKIVALIQLSKMPTKK